jgi:4-hydroxybenzoate polyprenyltransferase
MRFRIQDIDNIVNAMRPKQWTKNVIILFGLLFTINEVQFDDIVSVLLVIVAFILISSSVYMMNDVHDIERDRRHPVKQNRVIASGKVSIREALTVSSVIAIIGIFISLQVNILFFYLLLSYMFMNIAYSMYLKDVVLVDVFIISIGFLIRVISGHLVIDVYPSEWMLVAIFFLTLLISSGKRLMEIDVLGKGAKNHRKSLEKYNSKFIEAIMLICASSSIVFYALYIILNDKFQGVAGVIILCTLPVVIYAILRYVMHAMNRDVVDAPEEILYRDRGLFISALVWVVMVITAKVVV